MQRVLLVGKNSFLAKSFIEREGSGFALDAISHTEIDAADLTGYDCVVNMAYRWSYFNTPYNEEADFALGVARKVAESGVAASGAHFFMLSSRKVYGTSTPFPVPETAPLLAQDFYGTNCIATETRVRELLGERCTILRPANVFGFEPYRHTFFGLAITRLLASEPLIFNFSAFTPRDFLPVDEFARMLGGLVRAKAPGVFNVGSGVALPIGQVALWIIEGYGRGEIHITKPHEFDRFRLDISKLEAVIGAQPDLTETIREASVEIGRKIRDL